MNDHPFFVASLAASVPFIVVYGKKKWVIFFFILKLGTGLTFFYYLYNHMTRLFDTCVIIEIQVNLRVSIFLHWTIPIYELLKKFFFSY